MAEWDFPMALTKCIILGITSWVSTLVERPAIIPPTRGSVHPLDQLLTKAFSEQTRQGWETFFRGQISIYWRKAFAFACPSKDASVIDSLLCKLVQQLLKCSLELWENHNTILHGNTSQEHRARLTADIHERVEAAYTLYNSDPTIAHERDSYLFTRKTVAARLAGDADTLLGWLRSVEVSMNAQEKQRHRANALSEKFFLPFRLAGRERLQQRRSNSSALQAQPAEDSSILSSPTLRNTQSPTREELQIQLELSPYTTQQYRQRREQLDPVDNLSDTIFPPLFDADSSGHTTSSSTSSDTLAGPSPFHHLLLDIACSTDSSYCLSNQRDISLSNMTPTIPVASLHTPWRAIAKPFTNAASIT